MTTMQTREHALDWLRVGAWSGSLAAHVAVLVLIALPMTAPPFRRVAEPILARWIEPEPPPAALPEPPPPEVPQHVRHERVPAPAVPAPPIPVSAPTSAAVDPLPASPDLPATPGPSAPVSADLGSGGATRELAYASAVRPRYPLASVRAHEEGTVVLRVLVDAAGTPQRVEIARSSGHARLDAAAREALLQARFRPVLQGGEAVPAWGVVPVAFRLGAG